MKITSPYSYVPLSREEDQLGNRLYVTPSGKLPSVTTILSGTGDKTGLLEWREWVGEVKAEKIKKEATDLGTLVHTHLENHIMGIPRPGGNNMVRVQARKMADQILLHGFPRVDEVWGIESPLYYPGLYAGTSDLIGVFDGKPAIMDYKTAKKMKTRDKIQDYFCQGAAYCMAHNAVHGTDISQIVIFMVDREFRYQCFTVTGEEFDHYCLKMAERIDEYYLGLENGRTILSEG